MSESPSAPAKLFGATLSRLKAEFGLREITDQSGGAFMPLTSHAPFHQGQCGEVRVFECSALSRVVTCSLVAPAIMLDSHMVFAFTDAASPVPPFTLDSVQSADQLAFHLDLIPKVDLGINLPYIDWAFAPLNAAYEASHDIEGLERAKITPIQHAVMSPWMLVHRADADAFDKIGSLVDRYFDHWASLVRSGPTSTVTNSLGQTSIAARDVANRALIFSPEVDKVWGQISGLIGEEAGASIRDLLKGKEIDEQRD